MTLQPGESKEVIFVLSWYFPNRPLSYKGSEWNKPLPPNSPAIGNMYANWYNSSLDVANQLRENYAELSKRHMISMIHITIRPLYHTGLCNVS